MNTFIPGKIVKVITTKKGKQATLRYPQMEDVNDMTAYINQLSTEDTFILFSGEQITLEEEEKYLKESLQRIEERKSVKLVCMIGEKMVGVCDIARNEENKKRSLHVGGFGISIAQEYRGEGLGEELAKATIAEAIHGIDGLKTITLGCFASNEGAIKLYEKLGFKECGRLPKEFLYKGEYIDEVLMCMEV